MKKSSDYEYNKKYAKAYISKYDEIKIRVPKGEKERIQKHAESMGESVTKFIYRIVCQAIVSESDMSKRKLNKQEREKYNNVLTWDTNYNGVAVYALIDDNGKKYIGSSKNLQSRIYFHQLHMKSLLATGMDGYVCSKMQNAILKGGKTFHLEVLEELPVTTTKEDLLKREKFYIEKEGGISNTYNMKPI